MLLPIRPLFVAFLLPLCACSNAPQQPSDSIDDKTAESPYLGDNAADASPDLAELGTNPSAPTNDPIVTGALPTSARPDLGAVTGRWAADTSGCGEAGSIVTISSTQFENAGRVCAVTDLIDGGDGSVTATLSCPAGATDDARPELVNLTPAEGNLTLSFVGSDVPDRTLSSCP